MITLSDYNVERIGARQYLIPCERCGNKIKRTQFSTKRTYICDTCKGYINKKYNAKLKALEELKDIRTTAEKRFDDAIELITLQDDISQYQSAIECAEQCNELYGSMPEAVLAIVLIKNGYQIIPQQKIGTYKVDFAIPKCKAIIEVDGRPYHSNKAKQLQRDAAINYAIGLDWNIIHIDSEKVKDINKITSFINRALK